MKAVWNKRLRSEKNHTLAFVYTYEAAEGDCLELAASSLYRLYINGTFAGYGPARAAHGYSRLDCYDLSRFAGQQVRIVAEVFGSNINTYYIVDELPFFAAEIKRGTAVLAQAGDFTAYHLTDRVQKVQRFSFQRSFAESYVMEKCRSAFYCGEDDLFPQVETEEVSMNQLLERYVPYPTYAEVNARSVVESGIITMDETLPKWTDRSWTDISDKLKGFRREELTELVSDEVAAFVYHRTGAQAETLTENTYQVYDFGRTITGFFHTRLHVQQAATVYLIFDEIIYSEAEASRVSPFRNACCNIIKYKLQPGTYNLQNFEANSARFVTLAVTAGEVTAFNLTMIAYENPDIMDYSYDTGDAELNKIIDAAKNTLAQNAVDVLTDCPSRERAGWLCDSYFSSRTEALFTGKNLVERSFLQNYFHSPQSPYLPEGMLPMCYPADHNDGMYIPNWTMWLLLELRNYVNRTGDLEMKALARPRVYNLIKCFSKYLNEDGLLEDLESWVFVEWSRSNDPENLAGVNYPSNMLYAAALEAAGELYQDEALVQQAAAMRQVIREQSYDGTFFEDNRIRKDGKLEVTGHHTETCQYYAFYFGVASKEEDPELYHLMMTTFGPTRDAKTVYPTVYPSNAIVGNYLRLELLLRNHEDEQVLQECKAFFTQMAELTGTLWEHSRLTNSLNHGFASVAANYIIECVERKKA